jgi:hypothetical protein
MGDRASADSLRWNLDLILDHRGADMADLPGGTSGLLKRAYKGEGGGPAGDPASTPALVAELRGHERQAAQELGQWKTGGSRAKSATSFVTPFLVKLGKKSLGSPTNDPVLFLRGVAGGERIPHCPALRRTTRDAVDSIGKTKVGSASS